LIEFLLFFFLDWVFSQYKGYRVTALSFLPLTNAKFVYGSKDAGMTVMAESDVANELMKKAAKKLNLKPHLAGIKSCKEPKTVYSAADLEAHLTQDGKVYLLDFSRSLPPAPRNAAVKSSVFFQLLRPGNKTSLISLFFLLFY
jgi:hypothetical protein